MYKFRKTFAALLFAAGLVAIGSLSAKDSKDVKEPKEPSPRPTGRP